MENEKKVVKLAEEQLGQVADGTEVVPVMNKSQAELSEKELKQVGGGLGPYEIEALAGKVTKAFVQYLITAEQFHEIMDNADNYPTFYDFNSWLKCYVDNDPVLYEALKL